MSDEPTLPPVPKVPKPRKGLLEPRPFFTKRILPPQVQVEQPPSYDAAGTLRVISRTGKPKPTKLEREIALRQRKERRGKAYELWLSGAGYDQIGVALGISGKTAWYDVSAAKTERAKALHGAIDELRSKQYLQCERLIRALWPKAVAGDKSAHERIEAYMRRQASLYGLDAPLKVASTTPDGEHWAPIAVNILQSLSDEEVVMGRRLATLRLLPAAQDGELVASGGAR